MRRRGASALILVLTAIFRSVDGGDDSSSSVFGRDRRSLGSGSIGSSATATVAGRCRMDELGPLAAPLPPVAACAAVRRSAFVGSKRFAGRPLLGVGPGGRPGRPCIARRRGGGAVAVAPRGPALMLGTWRQRGGGAVTAATAVGPIGQGTLGRKRLRSLLCTMIVIAMVDDFRRRRRITTDGHRHGGSVLETGQIRRRVHVRQRIFRIVRWLEDQSTRCGR